VGPDNPVARQEQKFTAVSVNIAELPHPLFAEESPLCEPPSRAGFFALIGSAVVLSILAASIYLALRYLL
jgi:hypothetical protein